MLSKKHFKELAEMIRNSHGDYNELVNDLIRFCKASNPRFDEVRFREACQEVAEDDTE